MLKSNRLNILKLIKNKKLNNISKEIKTLNDEIKKSRDMKHKLKKINKNSAAESYKNNASNIRHQRSFTEKILQQIYLCENREIFLSKELNLAKIKLGKIILQKNTIEDKIKLLIEQQKLIDEKKIERDTPAFKNN